MKGRWDIYNKAIAKAERDRNRAMRAWKREMKKDLNEILAKAKHPLTLTFLDSNIWATRTIFLPREPFYRSRVYAPRAIKSARVGDKGSEVF